MALSMSISAGAHNARHNTDLEYRSHLDNVDPSLSNKNKVIADEAIDDAYDKLFGAAAEQYNAAQIEKGHPERCVGNYREKVESAWRADQAKVSAGKKMRSNVPQPCYEYVVQIGNRDTWRGEVSTDQCREIYEDAFKRIKEKTNGAIYWFQAAIHVDEFDGTPHLHIAGIPYGTGNKRGLETQVSMTQALRKLGLDRLPDLQNVMMKELEAAAHEHGIERDVMECDRPHQDVAAWKQTQRDVADMTEKLEIKRQQVLKIENEISGLQQERDSLRRDVGMLRDEISECRETLERLRNGFDSIVREIAEVADALSSPVISSLRSRMQKIADFSKNSIAIRVLAERLPINLDKDDRKIQKAVSREVGESVNSLKAVAIEARKASEAIEKSRHDGTQKLDNRGNTDR